MMKSEESTDTALQLEEESNTQEIVDIIEDIDFMISVLYSLRRLSLLELKRSEDPGASGEWA
jgi:hypothetical protein